jgi:osmotically-inducible protein OsmY
MKQRTALLALLLATVVSLAIGQTLFASDDSPQKQIQTALVEKLGADAKTINVAFSDGKAVLSGKVTEDSTQEIAKEVALWVPGVTSVDNKIEAANERMVGSGKLIAEQKDLGTESGVKDVLRREAGKLAGALEVEACNGVVSVRGSVPDKASHDQVLGLASKVVDVTKVIDLLRITG